MDIAPKYVFQYDQNIFDKLVVTTKTKMIQATFNLKLTLAAKYKLHIDYKQYTRIYQNILEYTGIPFFHVRICSPDILSLVKTQPSMSHPEVKGLKIIIRRRLYFVEIIFQESRKQLFERNINQREIIIT